MTAPQTQLMIESLPKTIIGELILYVMQTDQSVKKLRQRLFEVFPLRPVPERRISDAITCDNWGVSPEDWPEEAWND